MPTDPGTKLNLCDQGKKSGQRCQRPLLSLVQKDVLNTALCADCSGRQEHNKVRITTVMRHADLSRKKLEKTVEERENEKLQRHVMRLAQFIKEMQAIDQQFEKTKEEAKKKEPEEGKRIAEWAAHRKQQPKQMDKMVDANVEGLKQNTQNKKKAKKAKQEDNHGCKETKQSVQADKEEWDLYDREEVHFKVADEDWIECGLQ